MNARLFKRVGIVGLFALAGLGMQSIYGAGSTRTRTRIKTPTNWAVVTPPSSPNFVTIYIPK